ncbi:MAG: InlB B-repeat-containing protein, partial [Oscillospiraceae bacterium]|nr:InlB B-repeat-containing protein [Oscillospiraceae bacterium]
VTDGDVAVTAAFAQRTVVTLSASTSDGSASVGDIPAPENNVIYEGDRITLTAPSVGGYDFRGWYNGETPVCASLEYSFTITENTVLTAKYQARGDRTVTLIPENGALFYLVETADGVETLTQIDTEDSMNLPLGKRLTLRAADAGRVLHWKNDSGKVLGTGDTLNVTVTGSMSITLVYSTPARSRSFVQFVSDYGQVLAAAQYTSGSTIDFPTRPSKFGHTFEKWVFEGSDYTATEAAINANIGLDPIITVVPKYTRNDTPPCSITVAYSGVVRDASVRSGVTVGTNVTLSAEEIPGWKFECWKRGDTVLGYEKDYFFKATGDVTLTACYVEESRIVEAQPVVTLAAPFTVAEDSVHKVSCTATRSVPEGYELVEQGMLYARTTELTDAAGFTETSDNVHIYRSSDKAANGVLTVNAKVDSDDLSISFRAYMVLRELATGNEFTVYSSAASGSYASVGAAQ